MTRRLFGTVLLTLLVLGMATPAMAFRLVPIEMEFAPAGRGATQTFRLENDTADPVAVEIRMMSRRMTEQGEDQLEDAADKFTVYPEQVVLQPNQSQSVRVQWTGEANPAKELAFRLVAEQLPVDLGRAPPQGGQVRLLVRYVASLYVTPPGSKSDVKVVSVEPKSTPQGKRLEVTVANRGTMRQILREPTLTVQAGSKSIDLRGEQLTGMAGENVLAGGVRRFLIPMPAALAQGPLHASLVLPGR